MPLIAICWPGPGLSLNSRFIAAWESVKILKWTPGAACGMHNSTPRTSADSSASNAVAPPPNVHASATIPPSPRNLMKVLVFPLYVFSSIFSLIPVPMPVLNNSFSTDFHSLDTGLLLFTLFLLF